MDKTDPIWLKLQEFANNHKLIFEEDGQCGFGRACVGFQSQQGWVAYNPLNSKCEYIWEKSDNRMYSPQGVNAYHEHECMAVLIEPKDYENITDTERDAALEGLHQWVLSLEAHGELEVVDYETGNTGIQAMLNGVVGYAIRIKKTEQEKLAERDYEQQ